MWIWCLHNINWSFSCSVCPHRSVVTEKFCFVNVSGWLKNSFIIPWTRLVDRSVYNTFWQYQISLPLRKRKWHISLCWYSQIWCFMNIFIYNVTTIKLYCILLTGFGNESIAYVNCRLQWQHSIKLSLLLMQRARCAFCFFKS